MSQSLRGRQPSSDQLNSRAVVPNDLLAVQDSDAVRFIPRDEPETGEFVAFSVMTGRERWTWKSEGALKTSASIRAATIRKLTAR